MFLDSSNNPTSIRNKQTQSWDFKSFEQKMEQDFGSGCSSGCESGWTIYLGQSQYLCDSFYNTKNVEEDDDMSMVSDATSGPQHVQQQEQECNTDGFGGCKKQEIVKESRKINDLPCFLDDTASSPFFSFSHVGNNQDAVEEGDNSISDYSKNHFQGKSRFQDQLGRVYNSSVSGTQLRQNQWYERRWG
ncbi:hypothetical protein CTI12_AA036360 [Artemisia annua]|uniref:Uncharacterized protein n=1 Tax=Artemisia annua TaxID=35608 RepID=A0A2U1QFG5_ARTAN|nr:hypothetical protein CTI12_AA036360 [Artemisia annua]